MQLYAGLPIITNKITPSEQQGIPHHLLGCIGLQEQTWVVGTFVRHALRTIEEIRSRGRLPILVGGTHYYTQSLLFRDQLAEKVEEQAQREFVEDMSERWPILKQPTDVLLEELKKVDPVMAERWHPNDRRKIQRSLEIFLQTGKRSSEIYAEQREKKQSASEIPFSTLLFWVHAEPETLKTRLDKRVDKMLEQGLLEEVETLDAFARGQEAEGKTRDESAGIWASIGYKEFREYNAACNNSQIHQKELVKLKAEALEKTKAATRQYAKRQVRWIRIKLINALAEANSCPSLYLLDGSEVPKFDETVVDPALKLTGQFLRAEIMPSPPSLSEIAAEQLQPKMDDLSSKPETWTKQYCAVCDVTSVTAKQWNQHMASNAHKKRTSKARKATEREGG